MSTLQKTGNKRSQEGHDAKEVRTKKSWPSKLAEYGEELVLSVLGTTFVVCEELWGRLQPALAGAIGASPAANLSVPVRVLQLAHDAAQHGLPWIKWLSRGCSGRVLGSVTARGLAVGAGVEIAVEVSVRLFAVSRGQIDATQLPDLVIVSIARAGVAAGATAGLAAFTASVAPGVQALIVIAGAAAAGVAAASVARHLLARRRRRALGARANEGAVILPFAPLSKRALPSIANPSWRLLPALTAPGGTCCAAAS